MTQIIPLETEEQKALVQYLNAKKLFYFAVPNGAVLKGTPLQRARQMKKLKAEGLIAGTSDIVVLLKEKILFIEMKRIKKSTISKEQKAFLEKVNKFPYAVGKVCKGAKEAIEFIESHIKKENKG